MEELSIIITNYNRKDLLINCLNSIEKYLPKILNHTIYLVDDASTDGSAEYIEEKYPEIILIKNSENFGYVKSVNYGVRRSSGSYILLLDSDTQLIGDIFTPMLNFIKNDKIGAVGVKQLSEQGVIKGSCDSYPSIIHFIVGQKLSSYLNLKIKKKEYKEPYEVDVVYSSCILTTRRAFESAGFFDESFYFLDADVYYCYKLRQCGFKCYVMPNINITHSAVGGIGSFSRILEFHKSRFTYFKKIYSENILFPLKIALSLRHIFEVFFYSIVFITGYKKDNDTKKLKGRILLLKKVYSGYI